MPNDIPSEFERFVNQVAADTNTLKAVVSAFLAKMALTRGSTELIDELEEIAKLSLQPRGPSDGDQLKERLHHLTVSRMDDYFRDLRGVIETVQAKSRRGGTTN